MKTLSDIIQTNYGGFMDKDSLPELTDGTIVVAIMDDGYPSYCTPRNCHGITCPICGSSDGYRVSDPNGYWWACRRDECIQKNGGTPIEYYKPEIKIEDVLEKIGVSLRLRDASFDEWKHSKELKTELMRYARKPKEAYTFTGNNGVGKSYSSVAIIREYYRLHKDYPIFYNVSNLYQDWLSQAKSPIELMYKLSNAPLLVLDDLGTRTPTEAFCDFLYLIINSRYADMKGTVVTTNLSTEEVVEKFGNAIASRLFSGEIVNMEGNNLRIN